ncbi:MAG: putative sporulation protein YtxC [Firmicutes bacterium]|nr:putative sporulation protein YtxC [Bacillota bacterium]
MQLSIGTARYVDELRERLGYEFRSLEREGLSVDKAETSRGNLTFLGYDIRRNERTKYSQDDINALLKHYVANTVSDIIVSDWEDFLLKKIIKENYYYLSKEEQEAILKHVGEGSECPDRDFYVRMSRKTRVLNQLLEFFRSNNELVVEGFLTFRLKDYLEELEEVVDRAVDDFLMEKEYKEFVRLLKYFVDIQEPREAEVNIFFLPEGGFHLLDKSFNEIKSESLSEFMVSGIGENEVEFEDVLISSLITLSPLRIILHSPPQEERFSLETIKAVFGERVSTCRNCSRCKAAVEKVPQKER